MTTVPDGLRYVPVDSDIGQAVLYHARERRKSLAGMAELQRTHRFPIPTASIGTAAAFPARTRVVTFATAIRITANAGQHRGLIFELGDATTSIAAWVDDDEIGLRVGDTGADEARATFTTGSGELPVGWEIDLVFAVRPGDGRIRIYGNGRELARATAVNGQMLNGWAGASNGAFAAAANGTTGADVPQQGAPSGFDVILPLSVYVGQAPRHFF